jgi:cytoskeleton protein RodZ
VGTGIGATLREARNRRKVELSEVEAAIKIRVRYLLAIENEEWDALPGDAYARGFIRTYAYYLGLDGERLADDYRRDVAPPGDRVPKRVEPVPATARGEGGRYPGWLIVAVVCIGLLAAVVGIGLASGGGGAGGGSSPTPPPLAKGQAGGEETQAVDGRAADRAGVAMRLTANREVWVCLLDAEEKPLLDGQILAEGEEAGPFRSDGFELALGNGAVEMTLDGEQAAVEESSSPVGYRVDSSGKLIALEEGERPDCE